MDVKTGDFGGERARAAGPRWLRDKNKEEKRLERKAAAQAVGRQSVKHTKWGSSAVETTCVGRAWVGACVGMHGSVSLESWKGTGRAAGLRQVVCALWILEELVFFLLPLFFFENHSIEV